jgi:hypothetical protein
VPVAGLHCYHEQIPPSHLLEHVKDAEAAGFRAEGVLPELAA